MKVRIFVTRRDPESRHRRYLNRMFVADLRSVRRWDSPHRHRRVVQSARRRFPGWSVAAYCPVGYRQGGFV